MERRSPAVHNSLVNMEGRGEMMKAPIDLQDLRRRIYVKAKAKPSWRFWGLYVHVCKTETLHAACGCPALRAPAHFAPRFMKPIVLEPLSMRARGIGFDSP